MIELELSGPKPIRIREKLQRFDFEDHTIVIPCYAAKGLDMFFEKAAGKSKDQKYIQPYWQ